MSKTGSPRRPGSKGLYGAMLGLSGRVAVVTGGGRNIGLACAHAMAEAGARVVITGRPDSDTGAAGKAELEQRGFDVGLAHFDVTDPRQVTRAADEIAGAYGPVDVLVCNSAHIEPGEPAETMSDGHWLRMMDTNLNGVFWSCRAFGRHMVERGRGAIVNVGSMSGMIVNRPQTQAAYNTTKAAVHHLTRSLAVEWADRGVRVNAVAPTYVEKPRDLGPDGPHLMEEWMARTPMRRQGRAEEIASVVLFLASEASSLMTGAIVVADGGYTIV